MEVSKFCVLSVILASLCGLTKPQRIYPTSILIDTRFKRETEIDCRSRDHKVHPKIQPGPIRKPNNFRHVVPTAKILNPLKTKASNVLPRRHMIVPLINKPLKNTTEVKPNKYVNVPKLDKDSNNTDINKKVIPNDKSSFELPTQLKDEKNEVKIEEEKLVIVTPKVVTKEEIKNNSTLILEKEIVQITSGDTYIPEFNVAKEDLTSDRKSLLQETVNPDLENGNSVQETVSKLETKNEIHEKESDSMENETISNTVNNNITEAAKAVKLGAKVSLGVSPLSILNPLSVLTRTPKLLLYDLNKVQSPKDIALWNTMLEEKPLSSKSHNEDSSITSQNIIESENEHETIAVKKSNDSVLVNPSTIEPNEEIIIQNNNYEELYDSPPSPQYESPKVIVSEFRSSQNRNNLNPMPTIPCGKYETTRNYAELNKPYSYNIQRYPNHYVVNTYDGLTNRNYYNNNTSDYINAFQWNRGNDYFHQSHTPYGQWNNYNNNCGQTYPRIWRTWSNNHIIIRPKSVNTVNSAVLYKSINGYIANARNIPVCKGTELIGPNGNVEQNISSCSYSDPIWFNRRYGY